MGYRPSGHLHRQHPALADGRVKVVDFGIAKAANVGQQTQGGVIKGKLSYIPPEYLMGIPIDLRADVYALGVVLYELVAGRKPFMAENEALLVQAILRGQPEDVRTVRADVPAPLVQVLERSLHKDREARYSSCRQMQADLERFLFQCGEPVGALQLTELVKALSSTTEVSPVRRDSKESLTIVPEAVPASEQFTRSLRPSSPDAPTSPLTGPLVIPPSLAITGAEDEELLRLASRPRWHWPLAIVAGFLTLLGLAAHFSSEETVQPPSEAVASSAQSESLSPEEPLPSPTPVPSLTPPTEQAPARPLPEANPPPQESVGDAPLIALKATTEKAQTPPPVKAAARSGLAMMTITSNLPAQLSINGRAEGTDGKTFWRKHIAPGNVQIKINGRVASKRFGRVMSQQPAPGEEWGEKVRFHLATVGIKGLPRATVLWLDHESLDDEEHVEVRTYEGLHDLMLVDGKTGKTHLAECEVKTGEEVCRVISKNP